VDERRAVRPSDPIICDGEVMGPGDTCISTDASNNGSYEELVRKRREGAAPSARNGPTVAPVGGLVAAGGAVLLLAQIPRRLATRANAPADADWWIEGERP
jgi:hypothetical protein